jgi:nicotinate-nucleotide pyrophosphorylase (carboxylating)
MVNKLLKKEIIDIIKKAVIEDLGSSGDLTSDNLIPGDDIISSHIICKETGSAVLSGIDVAGFVLEEIDTSINMVKLRTDGDGLKYMDKICEISGPTLSILKAERTCLNFIQHMSGIATLTSRFVGIARPFKVKIFDTRKTKPTLRKIEKYAVTCGGGFNHRFGLFDGIIIKDNHIAAAGGVASALKKIKTSIPGGLKIEVEVKDFGQLDEAITGGADIIMLDNMDTVKMKKAVSIIKEKSRKSCLIEASGKVDLENLEEICKTGVDMISVGLITHSAPAIDFSLEFERET